MRKLWYMGLEPYQERYTLQLEQWTVDGLEAANVDHALVRGEQLKGGIKIGSVLDAFGRSHYCLTQMASLVKAIADGECTADDCVLFADQFTAGIEALAYIGSLSPKSMPRVFVRCLAQTIDPDDFTHRLMPWMRDYERMTCGFSTIVCTNEEMVAHARIAGWTAPIYNLSGLEFGKREVQSWVTPKPFAQRPMRVVYAARLDTEKQPWLFLELARKMQGKAEFEILCGSVPRSNDPKVLREIEHAAATGVITLSANLTKQQYYNRLSSARVLFNCALQDWTSNTVNEADAFGCNLVYPAYRSFPEVFRNDHTRLYVPWSIIDAQHKVEDALRAPHPRQGEISDWCDGSVGRLCAIMRGEGEQWKREGADYRRHINAH